MNTERETKKLNFEGQDFYIGIDVHKSSWKITIRTQFMELKTFSMEPVPEQLAKHMKRDYPKGNYHCVYEAGFEGFWIHRRLKSLGFDSMIVNPADVPTKHKEKEQKRDAIDSRKLARNLESRLLKGIYIPTEQQQAFRSVARLYQQKVQQRKKVKQRIKSFLHFNGIPIPRKDEISHWSALFIHYLQKIQFTQTEHNYCLQRLLANLLHYRKECSEILRYMRTLSRDINTINYLRSIPGIGCITAYMLYAEIMDIRRFNNGDALASFVGIVPSVHSSDEKEKVRGITARYNKYLRNLIIEASWIAARHDPALTEAFINYTKRMSRPKAIIRIARKLINRIRYVWLNESTYQMGIVT